MKKFVFALTLVSALVQPFAAGFAADFEPPPPTDDLRPATYDWSGLYAGAAVGATCIDGSVDLIPAPIVTANHQGCNTDFSAFTGFNYQMDNMVFGLEGELGMPFDDVFSDSSATQTRLGIAMSGGIKGRVGFAADNNLLYGTVGFGMVRANYGEISGASYVYQNNWHYGWTAGFGYERAITDVIRLRAEYGFARYNTDDSYTSTCGGCTNADVDLGDVHTFKLGVSYAF